MDADARELATRPRDRARMIAAAVQLADVLGVLGIAATVAGLCGILAAAWRAS
jgi:hypothetical protein